MVPGEALDEEEPWVKDFVIFPRVSDEKGLVWGPCMRKSYSRWHYGGRDYYNDYLTITQYIARRLRG